MRPGSGKGFCRDFDLYRILSDGVTGNTPDFDSGKSRFEPWSDNQKIPFTPNGIF
jgi:hypothetical protein